MEIIKYLFSQSKKLLILSTICSIISGLTGASLVGIIGQAVDQTGNTKNLAIIFFFACGIFFISKTISELSLLNLTQNAILRLRISLSNKILLTSARKLHELGQHGLLAVMTKDIDIFVQCFTLIPLAFGNAILIISCFVYLAWLSWKLFLILVIFLLFGLYGFHLAEQRPLLLMQKVRDQVDLLYNNFQGLIDGNRELKINSEKGRKFIDEIITINANEFKCAFIKSTTSYTWVLNVGAITYYIAIGIILFLVPILSPGTNDNLIAISLVMVYLSRPISDLMGAMPTLRQASISLQRMQQLDDALRDTPPLDVDELKNPFFCQNSLLLELNDVIHYYPSDVDDVRFKLGPMNLKIQQGESVFIIGGNGSGKTTLAMLLVGLYEIEAGAIFLNGIEMTNINRNHYRQHFSVVFADFHLFEHILDSSPDTTERATRYIHALGMDKKVRIVDGKFSTTTLSTGQRKRLALVASYLEDRPIYIFDEWAADQDPIFKRVFYTELLPDLQSQGKTIIVISHDDSYFDCADRILKLHDGVLVEIKNLST